MFPEMSESCRVTLFLGFERGRVLVSASLPPEPQYYSRYVLRKAFRKGKLNVRLMLTVTPGWSPMTFK